MKWVKLLFLVQAVCALLFSRLSEGLVTYVAEQERFIPVSRLASSGSDDDVAIVFMGLCSFASAFSLLVFEKFGGSRGVYPLAGVCAFVQSSSLLLPEVGSVYETIALRHDAFLLVLCLAHATVWLLLFRHTALSHRWSASAPGANSARTLEQ